MYAWCIENVTPLRVKENLIAASMALEVVVVDQLKTNF